MARTSARWKHPSDLSRGRAFLWTAPSQRVYHLLTYAISNAILKSSPRLASMRRARLGPFFPFPHPPTPVLSPYILYLPNPSPVEEDRWKGGFIRPVHRPSPHGAVDVKLVSPSSPQCRPLVQHSKVVVEKLVWHFDVGTTYSGISYRCAELADSWAPLSDSYLITVCSILE
jgi:hypothetical protein